MLRRRPTRPNAPAGAPHTAPGDVPITHDDTAALGDALLPPASLDALWVSVGADGRREILLRTGETFGGWAVVSGLTIVVADLGAASARYAAQFGCTPLAVDPAEMEEAGLAQRFALGPCWLTVLTPADDTDAADFLAEHGPGLYTLTLRDDAGVIVPSRRAGK